MGFRFRKSLNSGLFRLNLSKSGFGWSWGIPGLRWTRRADGRRQVTSSLPGSGLSYVHTYSKRGGIRQEFSQSRLSPEIWKWILKGLGCYALAFLALIIFPTHLFISGFLVLLGTACFGIFFIGALATCFSKLPSPTSKMSMSPPLALQHVLGSSGELLEELFIHLQNDWTKGVQLIQKRIEDPHIQTLVTQDPGLLFLVGVTDPSSDRGFKFITRFRQIWKLIPLDRQVLYQEFFGEGFRFRLNPQPMLGRHMDLSPWIDYACNLPINDQSAVFFLGHSAYQLENYRRVIQLLSGFSHPWLDSPAEFLVACAHYHLGQIPQAYAFLRSLAERETDKERKVALTIFGAYLLASQGDRRIGIIALQRYQRWQALPTDLKKILWYLLGRWLYEEEEFPQAQKWLERVMAMDTDFEDCQEILTNLRSKKYGTSGAKFRQGGTGPKYSQDPYLILGLSRRATEEEVKKAYRKEMGLYHPDRVAHLGPELQKVANQKARAINQAYDTIKKEKRWG